MSGNVLNISYILACLILQQLCKVDVIITYLIL